jgi:hypothetical protein
LSSVAGAQTVQPRRPDPLADARDLYNAHKYDDAISAAMIALALPAEAPAARVILARARLERFRTSAEASDLDLARDILKRVEPQRLAPRERVEFTIALGEAMYLDDTPSADVRYGGAAAEFEQALDHEDVLEAADRDGLFDWWALALDHQAQQGPETDRRTLYQRIVERADRQLAGGSPPPSAWYWLAAAARGEGDLPRAIGAGASAWIRAGAMGPRGTVLRDDVDRLMIQVILPERAQQLAPGVDAHPTLAALNTQWDQFKKTWTATAASPPNP